jgi:hypothetical protein
MAKKTVGIDPSLEKAIADLLKEVPVNKEWTLTDKMKILDRALKLEALKLKMTNDDWGSGFNTDEDE